MKLITMIAGGLVTVGIGTAVLTADPAPEPVQRPAISTVTDCEHRGLGHRQKHGGLEDDRFHRSKGEPVTCDSERDRGIDLLESNDADDHDDRDRRPEQREQQKDEKKDSPFHRRDTSVKPNLFDMIA